MAPHLDQLIPALLRELRCDDAVNRQNAAFAVGVLAEGCGSAMGLPTYQQVLQVRGPAHKVPQGRERAEPY